MDEGLHQHAEEAIRQMRRVGSDYRTVEAKAAEGGLPRNARNSVAAFANTHGGLLLLGLREPDFKPLAVDAARLAGDLAATCAEDLEPPIRPEIEIITIEGQQVVAALVDELLPTQKPCFVKSKGLQAGSYIRTHDGNRRLSHYEIHVLISGRGQPQDDMARVPGAIPEHLDPDLVASLLSRLRNRRGPGFASLDDDQILRSVGVLVGGEEPGISLAGLLALGRYPQQFVPQLNVTFVAYPTTNGEPLEDGTRFLDNESLDGSIPVMLSGSLAAIRRNLTRRAIVTGEGRRDRWEYPEEALRELVVNALMHRDYHPLAHGSQIRIELYPDRLEITSPGGLHGPIDRQSLFAEAVTSSRNSRLAKLLEDVELPRSGRTVCENRASGLVAIAHYFRNAGLEPPVVKDDVKSFQVVLRNDGLLNAEAAVWLSMLDLTRVSDNQRLGLAFMGRNGVISNSQYRVLTGCEPKEATQDLVDLMRLGIIERSHDRLWPTWRLSSGSGYRKRQPGRTVGNSSDGGAGKSLGRRAQIRFLLASGPKSAGVLAEELGMTRGGLLRWLRRMEEDGEVRPTEARRQSPRNRWKLDL
ncbi:MAG: transcriptional regulator [Acidimicrobiia bacterium]|nr:transcriptional regulator [Acidimicrobiia bacterium]MYB78250.1 transcriptional regulator [Acidimicrobiia bacterium]MYH06157.1 transcriptional regulator [Acidimicrobiia bacterium]